MELKEAIYTRRAVREFKDEPVDETLIRQLIDAAIQAPSAVNHQPWLFHGVRSREVLGRMSREIADHMLHTSPAAASRHFQEMMVDPNFDILHHAATLIVISSAADSPWAAADCAAAAENLMLDAHGA